MSKVNPYKWHFVDSRHIPRWVKRRFRFSGPNYQGTIESFGEMVSGRRYQYAFVVVILEHTHDNAIVRRKIDWRRVHHHRARQNLMGSLWEFIKRITGI